MPEEGPYLPSTKISLTATANARYQFLQWAIMDSIGSKPPRPENPTTITMDRDKTATAVFVPAAPTDLRLTTTYKDADNQYPDGLSASFSGGNGLYKLELYRTEDDIAFCNPDVDGLCEPTRTEMVTGSTASFDGLGGGSEYRVRGSGCTYADDGQRLLCGDPGPFSSAVLIPDVSPVLSDATGEYTFTRGVSGSFLVPEAVGGNGWIDYHLLVAEQGSGHSAGSRARASVLPAGIEFDSRTRVLSGRPTAVTPRRSYTLVATDRDGDTDTMQISIEVRVTQPPPPPPACTSWGASLVWQNAGGGAGSRSAGGFATQAAATAWLGENIARLTATGGRITYSSSYCTSQPTSCSSWASEVVVRNSTTGEELNIVDGGFPTWGHADAWRRSTVAAIQIAVIVSSRTYCETSAAGSDAGSRGDTREPTAGGTGDAGRGADVSVETRAAADAALATLSACLAANPDDEWSCLTAYAEALDTAHGR